MKEEIWKDIEGYEGKYQVSNLGRVKSLGRVIERRGQAPKITSDKILSTRLLKGYPTVRLNINNTSKTFSIHRLIAHAFIPNPNNLPHIDHINTIRIDNRIENLRWVSRSMNMLNETTRKKRTEYWNQKTQSGNNAWVERRKRAVEALDADGKVVYQFDTVTLAANFFGVNHSNICIACKDIRRTCQSYHWRYAE